MKACYFIIFMCLVGNYSMAAQCPQNTSSPKNVSDFLYSTQNENPGFTESLYEGIIKSETDHDLAMSNLVTLVEKAKESFLTARPLRPDIQFLVTQAIVLADQDTLRKISDILFPYFYSYLLPKKKGGMLTTLNIDDLIGLIIIKSEEPLRNYLGVNYNKLFSSNYYGKVFARAIREPDPDGRKYILQSGLGVLHQEIETKNASIQIISISICLKTHFKEELVNCDLFPGPSGPWWNQICKYK